MDRKIVRVGENRELLPREESFIAALLGPAEGNVTGAAEIAGYRFPADAGQRLLKRPAVLKHLREAQTQLVIQAGAQDLPTKQNVINRLWSMLANEDEHPMARVKGAEVLVKVLGYLAPSRSIQEHVSGERGSYGALLATLKENGGQFTDEERKSIVAGLLADMKIISEIMALLGPIEVQ